MGENSGGLIVGRSPPGLSRSDAAFYGTRVGPKTLATVSSGETLLSNRPPGSIASTRQAPGPNLPARWSAVNWP